LANGNTMGQSTPTNQIPAMIDERRVELEVICRRHGVARLELFGSALTGSFDPQTSDLDFLVEFLPEHDLGPWMKDFFDLIDDLQELFGRKVDLVFGSGIRNPYLKRNINATRTLLYAA
jgi:predicted nucleotidyltransferase